MNSCPVLFREQDKNNSLYLFSNDTLFSHFGFPLVESMDVDTVSMGCGDPPHAEPPVVSFGQFPRVYRVGTNWSSNQQNGAKVIIVDQSGSFLLLQGGTPECEGGLHQPGQPPGLKVVLSQEPAKRQEL